MVFERAIRAAIRMQIRCVCVCVDVYSICVALAGVNESRVTVKVWGGRRLRKDPSFWHKP